MPHVHTQKPIDIDGIQLVSAFVDRTDALNKILGFCASEYSVDDPGQSEQGDFATVRFDVTFDPSVLTPDSLSLVTVVCNTRHVAIEICSAPDKCQRVAITAAEIDPLEASRRYPGIPAGPCFVKLWPERIDEALQKARASAAEYGG